MRFLLCSSLLFPILVGCSMQSPVHPDYSAELSDLRATVRELERENQLLKEQLADFIVELPRGRYGLMLAKNDKVMLPYTDYRGSLEITGSGYIFKFASEFPEILHVEPILEFGTIKTFGNEIQFIASGSNTIREGTFVYNQDMRLLTLTITENPWKDLDVWIFDYPRILNQ